MAWRWSCSIPLILTLSIPASAQQMQGCEDHDSMLRKLKDKYHEQRAEVGLNEYGWLIELFEADDGKTWTLVGTRPGGPACVFGTGTDWQSVEPTKGHPAYARRARFTPPKWLRA